MRAAPALHKKEKHMAEEKVKTDKELEKEQEQLSPEELEQVSGGKEQTTKHTN